MKGTIILLYLIQFGNKSLGRLTAVGWNLVNSRRAIEIEK